MDSTVIMKTLIKSPSECTDFEINEFVRLTIEGGQVSSNRLKFRIKNAEKLVFIWKNDSCVAIAGLKNPSITYRQKVFCAAEVKKERNYQYEIGYIYSTIKNKGVGSKLMLALLKASKNASLFATTQKSNQTMHYLLDKSGFKQLGQYYLNNNETYYLGLYGRAGAI